jgi:spoIIIJ-associated protein
VVVSDSNGGGDSGEGKRVEAERVLGEILRRIGIVAEVRASEDAERITLDIAAGEEGGLIIGKKGATLDALQYMVNKIVNRDLVERKPILLDTEGYRGRREDSLVELAQRLSEKVRRTNRAVTMSPMSPHDRRIIHLALDKVPGVTTRSEGEGAFRRLMILPAPDKQVDG